MHRIDTGKYSLSRVGDKYVHIAIYSDHELTTEEAPILLSYFRQFDGPVPVLVDRKGRYALSADAQLAIIEHASELFCAMGFLDHSPLQRRITQIASITYLRGIPVKSFTTLAQAETWLERYAPLPRFKTE